MPTPPGRVKRHPERGRYDSETIHAILDEGLVCHVAVVQDHVPIMIPMLYVRIDRSLYVHGALAAGLFARLETTDRVSVAVTLLDGLVLARSWYNHSANYRSVVLVGHPQEVTDSQEKLQVLKAMADKTVPGRWDDARAPSETEIKITRIYAISIDQASAKIRQGPPIDDPEDLSRPTWAGVLPGSWVAGDALQDPEQSPTIPLPPYLKR